MPDRVGGRSRSGQACLDAPGDTAGRVDDPPTRASTPGETERGGRGYGARIPVRTA
jgi:hypothetical protein